jgi:hypothetical protein
MRIFRWVKRPIQMTVGCNNFHDPDGRRHITPLCPSAFHDHTQNLGELRVSGNDAAVKKFPSSQRDNFITRNEMNGLLRLRGTGQLGLVCNGVIIHPSSWLNLQTSLGRMPIGERRPSRKVLSRHLIT